MPITVPQPCSNNGENDAAAPAAIPAVPPNQLPAMNMTKKTTTVPIRI